MHPRNLTDPVAPGAGIDHFPVRGAITAGTAIERGISMKLAGMLLLLAGWGVVIFAVVLLASPISRGLFIFSGLGVEVLGLVLAFRKEAL
jgi:hypothetical protein